jgi:hypothetical protein
LSRNRNRSGKEPHFAVSPPFLAECRHMGSKPFQLDQKDIREILKVMAIAGISAALVAGSQYVNQLDLGVVGPVVTAALTALIKAVQQWASDNVQPEPK